ncbi:hypothetical protein GGI11_004601 [Coemansia sp. RSA 2049]|nr:hypothetical protein H4217_006855 [Coemansia sp. RSA 1939]KAJ2512862.1 hypothetical protein GGI11_004601 [Coemansia sp. RSA 2049]KAJ2609724.1 hypothetical protein EV177_004325 [Coemansia sp. RSA 1804]KAJ2692009.1 hypothetical protein GGH99_002014 [Coemansia sp. RSA 1285]
MVEVNLNLLNTIRIVLYVASATFLCVALGYYHDYYLYPGSSASDEYVNNPNSNSTLNQVHVAGRFGLVVVIALTVIHYVLFLHTVIPVDIRNGYNVFNRTLFILIASFATLQDPLFLVVMRLPGSDSDHLKQKVFPILGGCLACIYVIFDMACLFAGR